MAVLNEEQTMIRDGANGLEVFMVKRHHQIDFASGALVEVLPDYKCIYADGALPAMWIVFADRRVLRRTRLLADFIVDSLGRR